MFTLYSADFINAPSNCSYPHKVEVTDPASFAEGISFPRPGSSPNTVTALPATENPAKE